MVSPPQETNSLHVLQIAYLVSSEMEQNSQTGNLQVVLSWLERGVKTSGETLLSVTLVVDEVQPSNKGVTDSEKDDDGNGEAVKIVHNTRTQVENDTFITERINKKKLKRMRLYRFIAPTLFR